MKKITFLLISIFTATTLMAQIQVMGVSSTFPSNRGVNASTVVYSQMTPIASGNAYASQQFPDFSDSRLQSADDFVVPAGSQWNLVKVDVLGAYFAGSGPADSFIVEIYRDSLGYPKTNPMHSQSGLTYSESSGLYSIDLSSAIALSPGHYWISVMADMSFTVHGQWGWTAHSVPQINNEFSNRDPDQLLGATWPANWAHGSSTIGSLPSYDFCFTLHSSPSVPLHNWPIYFGLLLMTIFVAVKYRKQRIA